jgi:poly(glycerol-phosphate) alpha-glucosyltransferase
MRDTSDSAASNLAVAIVCASVSRAGGGIFPIMQAHARQLTRMGVSVSVLGLADAFSELDRSTWAPLWPRCMEPVHRGFAYAPALARALLDVQLDIVHQHGLWLYPSIAVTRWRQRRRRPVVISTQGMLEPWALGSSWAKKAIAAQLFERSNLQLAACLHCSQAEVEGVRRFGLKNPIAVLPNGIDLPQERVSQARPDWLASDGRRALLFLGRLHPKKGIRETLDAWALLKATAPDIALAWRLVISGWDDGAHREFLIAHAHALGLADDVLFPGQAFGKEKDAVLANVDAFILASYSEGQPIAVLEAWSHALPVFITRGCNLAEGFTAGAAIEITTNPAELSATLARSLASPKLASIGLRGRELVAQKFAWEMVVRELLAVYTWLARGGERPACVVLN